MVEESPNVPDRNKGDRLIAFTFAVLSFNSALTLTAALLGDALKSQHLSWTMLFFLPALILGACLIVAISIVVLPSMRRSADQYFKLLKLPAVMIATTTAIFHVVAEFYSGNPLAITTNVVNIVIVAYAGWSLAKNGGFGIWKSALAGLLLLFLELGIGGGLLLAKGEWMAFFGSVISSVTLAGVPMLAGIVGGVIGQRSIRVIGANATP